MGKEQEFDLENIYFELNAVKQSNLNEMLLMNYNLEQQTPLKIKITKPDKQTEIYNINKKEGFLNFLWDQSGIYMIYFQFAENYYLKSNNNGIKGIFKILSTESAFNLDLTKDNIEFEEFSMMRDEAPSLKFIVSSLNQDYIKKIVVENTDFNDINKIVSVNKNNEGDKDINFNYYTFEKDTKYTVTIKFTQKDDKYGLEKVNIISFSTENIKDISKGNITYNDINDKFIIIEWNKISDNILISNKDNDAKFYISKLSSKNLVKEFQNLNFNKLDDLNVTKPEKTNYSVLMIQLSKARTEINFDYEIKTEPNPDNKSDNKFPTVYIVLISVGGLLVLIIVIFLIIRCIKRKQDIDFTKKAEEIKQEKLLSEL